VLIHTNILGFTNSPAKHNIGIISIFRLVLQGNIYPILYDLVPLKKKPEGILYSVSLDKVLQMALTNIWLLLLESLRLYNYVWSLEVKEVAGLGGVMAGYGRNTDGGYG
jgi:hypothetical protein